MRQLKSLVAALLPSVLAAGIARAETVMPPIIAVSASPPGGYQPANATPPFTPAQIQQAYGIGLIQAGSIAGDGSGQTIAIVDAYHYPNALATLNTFSSTCGLPQFNATGGPTFTQLDQNGGTNYPATNSTWAGEEALDIEWAHAIAPKANIILYEATDNDLNGVANLETAVNTARNTSGVSVVSMSWGGGEFSGQTYWDSNLYTTPANRLALHQGVTFVAATGDTGSPGQYPAYSPNVVAVGGTTLNLQNNNSYLSETGWSGSGGGISTQEEKPPYQSPVLNLIGITRRATPDVSFDADPASGVLVYDPFNGGWFRDGGTSLAAPCWAGLIAIADQLRADSSLGSLDGVTQTLPALYGLPASDFHDITSGSNGGFTAVDGYDEVTGLGTPVANLLVADLAAVPEPSAFALLASGAVAALGYAWRRRRATVNGYPWVQ